MAVEHRARFALAEALEATGLASRADDLAGGLTTYDRRVLDIARCILGRPKLIMFDEPGGGMSREETRRLGLLLAQVPELSGGAVTLVIDHDVELIRDICEETLVLDFGRRIAFGPTAAVLEDPKVKAAYLGIGDVE
ncbi:ABC transporter ATP-binding protein C-terminal domain-containing protein [Mangrovicoccus ximenensis]|uniref:ABC transporter ATP-binding protein C-terminal domain-containing protein n=1 Tax=Mangrovicoccus ximenensis TaxID=1911570 RepID=UPI000D37CF06|nr:hypothetical protein [Mangrovicoccus ximenensis]